jgi:O-antigen/teichoic acid export membrane protein
MARAKHPGSLLSLGRRIGRHSGVYASGSVATFFFALVNVAVLTRLLPIEEYGLLAVYLFFATFLTILYNLGSLQGIFGWVFGAGDGEELIAEEGRAHGGEAENRERALFTGLLLTLGIASLGTAFVFAAAPFIAHLLGAPEEAGAVRLAALCGATGAIWRLVHNVIRFERRPTSFTVFGIARPAFALALSIAFVDAGYGVEGALAGVALGTALAIAVCLLATRRNYALGLEPGAMRQISATGAFFVPIAISMWVITNADVYLVSLFAPADTVGPYRVASRLGGGTSYFVAAVLMAWIPLTRTPLHEAVDREHGVAGFGAMLLTAFSLLCIWVVLGLALLGDVLIRIAPGGYASAAPLVPLIALGVVVYGIFMVLYRSSDIPNKRRHYLSLIVLAMVVFLGLALVLVPPYGGYGAAIAEIAGFAVAAAIMLWLSRRSERPLPIEYGRLARGIALGLLCIAVGQVVSPLAGGGRVFVDLAILIAFPVLLVAVRAFPREELRTFVDVSLPGSPLRRRAKMLEGLRQLSPPDRQLIATLVQNGRSAAAAATELGLPEDAMLRRFVATLRALGPYEDAEHDAEHDAEIAGYLLADGGVASRDARGRRLHTEGVDAIELDTLDLTLLRLRRIPRREWQRVGG